MVTSGPPADRTSEEPQATVPVRHGMDLEKIREAAERVAHSEGLEVVEEFLFPRNQTKRHVGSPASPPPAGPFSGQKPVDCSRSVYMDVTDPG